MPKTEKRQRLSKDALRTDRIYFSPNGPIPISRKRAQHWVEQFKRMSAAGLSIPMPFEHADSAKPGNSQFLKSKKNFGTLDELSIDAEGQLCFSCTPRDGVIGERHLPKFVSPEIVNEFRDTTGRVWKDVLTHMALTDVPVNAGQSDKWEIKTDRSGRQVSRMSLAGTWRMADDDESDDDMPPADTETGAPPTETPAAPTDDILRGVNADDQAGQLFRTVVQGLASLASPIVLPEDTTPDNFFERMATALIAMQGAQSEEPAAPPDEYEEEQNYMTGTGVTAMSTQPQSGAGKPDPNVLRLSALERYVGATHRSQLTSRLKALVESGRATPDEQRIKLTALGTERFSVGHDGIPSPSMVEAWIESREALPRGALWPAEERMSLEELENPDTATRSEDREENRQRASGIATAPIRY